MCDRVLWYGEPNLMSSIGLVDHFDRLQCGLLVFSDTDRLHNCHRHINS